MTQRLKRVLVLVAAVALAAPLIAVVLPYAYAFGAGRLWDKAEPELHLLPAGFIGPVVILLGDSAAPPPERERRTRLFRIPPNGVVRSRFPVNDGWGLPNYFYVDTAGHRTKIVSGAPCERDLPGDPIQACLLGHTRFGDLPDRPYQAYVVGRRADQQRWGWPAEYFVDSVVYGRRP